MKVRKFIRKTIGGGRRGFALLTLAVVGVLILGTGLIGLAETPADSASDPETPRPSTSATPQPSASPSPSAPRALSMESSIPQELSIPAMKVEARLQVLDQEGSKYVDLPKKASQPGWYKESATPGELGISTLIGYIRKSKSVPGVFVHLGKLEKGDHITITRKDKSEAVFRVDKVKSYPQKKFSEDEVYGQTKRRSELRIITCGGTLKPKDPPSNVVVFAHLVNPAD